MNTDFSTPIETIGTLIKLPSCLNNMLADIEVLDLNFQMAAIFSMKTELKRLKGCVVTTSKFP